MFISPSSPTASSTSHQLSSRNATQRILAELRLPIATLTDLESLLWPILSALDTTVPHGSEKTRIRRYTDLSRDDVLRTIPTIQHLILSVVLPVWLVPLREVGHEPLVKAFFCPPSPSSGNTAEESSVEVNQANIRCDIVVSGLSTLVSHMSTLDASSPGPSAVLRFSISTLEEIIMHYNLYQIHSAIHTSSTKNDSHTRDVVVQKWEDYVSIVCSLPGKIANASQGPDNIVIPEALQHENYFSALCVSAETLLFSTSQRPLTDFLIQSCSHLLQKFIRLGLYPRSPPSLPTQPSFFSSTLPIIRRRFRLASLSTTSSNASTAAYAELWISVVKSLPVTSQQTLFASLLGAFDFKIGREVSVVARRQVHSAAEVLRGLIGSFGGSDNEEIWGVVAATMSGSKGIWDLGVVRAVVAWVANPHEVAVDEPALKKLLDATVAVWTNIEYIKRSLFSQHHYLTSLFLMTLAAFPPTSEVVKQLAFFPPFIASISTFLSHHDNAIRRCGMLVAEVVAGRCGQKLAFGGWDDPGDLFDWARALRGWENDWTFEWFTSTDDAEHHPPVETKELPKHVPARSRQVSPITRARPPRSAPQDSDDDSLSGYSSSGRSSHTPSPTPSELDEIEQDPSLRVGRTKPIPRPVYLAQLAALLKTDKNDDKDLAERTEVVLKYAEQLIRRKKGFGFELDENAVDLTISLLTLRDNYELDGFDEKRQGAITALVECCPHKVAPTIIEQIFTNQYSTSERIMMLTSLAIGARVLAGLAVPSSTTTSRPSITFPSKMLPPALHQRYATTEEQPRREVQGVVEGITRIALERSKEDVENALGNHPEVIRERRLRLGSTARGGRGGGIQVLNGNSPVTAPQPAVQSTFTPLFTTIAAEYFVMPLVNHMWLYLRDSTTRLRDGAGTRILLDAMVQAQYLRTLTVLVHASSHAPAFLAVIAPAAMELAITLGSKPFDRNAKPEQNNVVLTAALEAVLIVLEACADFDGGRTLALEHTILLKAVGAWAGEVLDKGGERHEKVAAAAAGVVIWFEKIEERWGRAMIRF